MNKESNTKVIQGKTITDIPQYLALYTYDYNWWSCLGVYESPSSARNSMVGLTDYDDNEIADFRIVKIDLPYK